MLLHIFLLHTHTHTCELALLEKGNEGVLEPDGTHRDLAARTLLWVIHNAHTPAAGEADTQQGR
jgi:hypothetical protein